MKHIQGAMRHLGRPRMYHGRRLCWVLGFLGMCFVAIFVRLAYVQLIKHAHLSELAARQHSRHVTLRPERGRIFDRHGRILATSVPVPSVYAIPHDIDKPETTARQLAPILGQPVNTVRAKLMSPSSFVWLARQMLPDTVERLQSLGLRGVHVFMETRRFYPKRHLAGQVLGFVGVDEQGLGGLELLHDQALSGTPRRVTLQRDAVGRSIRLLAGDNTEHPRGADLYLTLDERLQYIAEKEIAEQVQKTQAKQGLVVLMHPETGDILALASYPFFNPNNFQDPRQQSWQRNRAITDQVEPGSTFKLVIAAAALEEKLVRAGDIFYCENGLLVRSGRRLRDHHRFGMLTMAKIIEQSSNIGTVKVNERLSAVQLYRYMRHFGFGELSMVDLPGEESGLVRPPRQWSRLSHDSLALGQEVTITPVQLATAYATVANGGKRMRPRVVEHIVQGEEIRDFPSQVRQRVLTPQTVEQLSTILTGVVERGTGKQAALEGYSAAGKTGTAQKAERGVYSHSKVLASFVGYTPVEAPQLVILVMIDEPQVARWGGEAAAPVFRRVAEQALHYLQIPPRQAQPWTLAATPSQATLPVMAGSGQRELTHVALATESPGNKERRP